MTTTAQRKTHLGWLKEVTALPTAAGCEDRVINWVEQWVKARGNLTLRRDKAGNLIVTQKRRSSARAIFITAHMDHPAFVVRKVISPRGGRAGVPRRCSRSILWERPNRDIRRQRSTTPRYDHRTEQQYQTLQARQGPAVARDEVSRALLHLTMGVARRES